MEWSVRRRVAVVLLVLLAASGTYGCNKRYYEWSSDRGRQCFLDCQRGRYQCNAGCFNNAWCQSSCNNDEAACMDSCPDLRLVRK